MSLVVLTHDSDFARYVVHCVGQHFDILGIVVTRSRRPPPPKGWKSLVYTGIGPAMYGWLQWQKARLERPRWQRRIESIEKALQQRALRDFRRQVNDTCHRFPSVPTLRTEDVNAQQCVAWCRDLAPDLTLVYGTPILKQEMIAVASIATLNAHGSLLPEYRGTRSAFWQCLRRDYEHCGVTVHCVDQGVDTGDIVAQVKTPADDSIDPFQLNARNVLATGPLFLQAIQLLLDSNFTPVPQLPPSTAVFRGRDLTLERRAELLRRLGYL